MIYLICGEKMERVQKVIANRGYTSRRNAEKLIEEGKVKVNGNIIKLGDKKNENDKIEDLINDSEVSAIISSLKIEEK